MGLLKRVRNLFGRAPTKASLNPRTIPEPLRLLEHNLRLGDVVLLWWIANPKVNHDKVPGYFHYKYGIEVSQEIIKLTRSGYIKNGMVTEKGNITINKYSDIIYDHRYAVGEFRDGTKMYRRGHIKGYDKAHQHEGELAQTTKQILEVLESFREMDVEKYRILADPDVPQAVALEGIELEIDKVIIGENCPPFVWNDTSSITSVVNYAEVDYLTDLYRKQVGLDK